MKLLPFGLLCTLLVLGPLGCFATKMVSVPMRMAGALVSVVPVVGNTAHDAVDEAADLVDKLPY